MSHDKVLPIRSLIFLDQQAIQERGDEIVVPQSVMTSWMDLFPPGTPMLARITNMETDISRVVCIGSSDSSEYIYAPNWIMEHMGCSEEPLVYLAPYIEEIPRATKLNVRQLGDEDHECDLRGAFERLLDRFHVMESGTTLCVPLEELGGYEILAYVESVEPAGLVKLGGEVQIEFLENVEFFEEAVVEEQLPVVEEQLPVVLTQTAAVNTVTEEQPVVLSAEEQRAKMREYWIKRGEALIKNLNSST